MLDSNFDPVAFHHWRPTGYWRQINLHSLESFETGQGKEYLVVNVDKAAPEKAPSFDPKEWPKVVDPEALKKVELYYK